MNAKHTPGPWIATFSQLPQSVWKEAGTTHVWVIREKNNPDKILDGVGGVGLTEENAVLIAAAPEMLEMLKIVHNSKHCGLPSCSVCQLIAKAEGR
jgi:hypothetical protein